MQRSRLGCMGMGHFYVGLEVYTAVGREVADLESDLDVGW